MVYSLSAKKWFYLLVTMCLCNILQAEVKVNLAALKQDCESLKAKIVRSPERFKGVSTIRWTCVLCPLMIFNGTDFVTLRPQDFLFQCNSSVE